MYVCDAKPECEDNHGQYLGIYSELHFADFIINNASLISKQKDFQMFSSCSEIQSPCVLGQS